MYGRYDERLPSERSEPMRRHVRVASLAALASASGAGNLRAWPADQTMPNASVLNYAKVLDQTSGLSLNLANGIVIPVSQDAVEGSDISIRASNSGTDVVVDVVGYFGPLGATAS